jgi:hypothetical protein
MVWVFVFAPSVNARGGADVEQLRGDEPGLSLGAYRERSLLG